LVVFWRREIPQFAVTLDEPECGCDDTDANRWVTRLEPLERGHRDAQTLRPGSQ
jgi:hypothetical protein